MSVKKIVMLGVAGVAAINATATMAGGFTQEPMTPVADNGYYIEGHLGYARQDYFDARNWRTNTSVSNNSNVNGGFSAAVDTGYKINRHYAVELGWFYLPTVNVMPASSASANLTSWVLYLAGKYMMPLPLMSNTDLFFKLGVAYRSASLASAAQTQYAVSTGTSSFVRPMFATGLDYSFSDSWSGIFQYAYLLGAANSFPLTAANTGSLGTIAANVFTLGLGYKFTI